MAAAAMLLVLSAAEPLGHAAPEPAGTTAAVLSMVDAADGRVEITRHWPAAPSDIDVYPFVPYFWDGCPGPGAVMVLVTGPPGIAPAAAQIADILQSHVSPGGASEALVRLIDSLRTPGDPIVEALKAAAPWVADLASYERWGYAVFLFVHWDGLRCAVTLQAVPEGYGIPFVR